MTKPIDSTHFILALVIVVLTVVFSGVLISNSLKTVGEAFASFSFGPQQTFYRPEAYDEPAFNTRDEIHNIPDPGIITTTSSSSHPSICNTQTNLEAEKSFDFTTDDYAIMLSLPLEAAIETCKGLLQDDLTNECAATCTAVCDMTLDEIYSVGHDPVAQQVICYGKGYCFCPSKK